MTPEELHETALLYPPRPSTSSGALTVASVGGENLRRFALRISISPFEFVIPAGSELPRREPSSRS